MKTSVICPNCGARIKTIIVDVYTYGIYNPTLEKVTRIVGSLDHGAEGRCPKCGGSINEELFYE